MFHEGMSDSSHTALHIFIGELSARGEALNCLSIQCDAFAWHKCLGGAGAGRQCQRPRAPTHHRP